MRVHSHRVIKSSILVFIVIVQIYAQSLGVWERAYTRKGLTPSERYQHACEVHSNQMFVYGGRQGINTFDNNMYVYNIDEQAWTKVNVRVNNGNAPTLFGHSLTLVGNKLYIFGGRAGVFTYSHDLYEYDIQTETLSLVDTKGLAPSKRQGHSAVALDRYLIIYGGSDGTRTFSDAFAFNTVDKTWTSLPPSPIGTEGHGAVLLGNRMYVFGGYDGGKYVGTVQVLELDMESKTFAWTTLATSGKPRAYHSATLVEQRVYIFGGLDSSSHLSDPRVFDISRGTWLDGKIDGTVTERQGHCAVAHLSNVIVFGGNRQWHGSFNDVNILRTQLQDDLTQKSLSEYIDEAVLNINILITGSEYGQSKTFNRTEIDQIVSAENQLKQVLSSNLGSVSVDEVTRTIESCHTIEQMYDKLQKVEQNTAPFRNRVKSHFERIESATKEYNSAKERLLELTRKLEDRLGDLRELERNVVIASQKAQSAKNDMEHTKETLAQVITKQRELSDQVHDKNNAVNLINSEISNLHNQLIKLNRDYEIYSSSVNTTELEIESLDGKIRSIENEINVAKSQYDKWSNETKHLDIEIRDLERNKTRLDEIKGHFETVKSKWEMMADLKNEYEKEYIEFIRREDGFQSLDKSIEEENIRVTNLEIDIQNQLQNYTTEIENAKKKLELLKSKQPKINQALEEKKGEYIAEKNRILRRRDDSQKEASSLLNKKSAIEKQLQDANERYKKESSELNKLRIDLEMTTRNLEQMRKEIAKRTETYQEQYRRKSEAKNKLDQLTQELKGKYEELNQSFNDAKLLNNKLFKLRQEVRDAQVEFATTMDDIEKWRNKLSDAIHVVHATGEAECLTETATLRRRNAELESEVADLKRQLAAVKSGSTVPATSTEQVEEPIEIIHKHTELDELIIKKPTGAEEIEVASEMRLHEEALQGTK